MTAPPLSQYNDKARLILSTIPLSSRRYKLRDDAGVLTYPLALVLEGCGECVDLLMGVCVDEGSSRGALALG